MPDEITGIEDLAQLRVVFPNDRRQFDWWAFDDNFCSDLLDHAFARPARRNHLRWHWERAIQIYWRENKTRHDLANELALALDSVKSLVATIRKTADDFIAGGRLVQQAPDRRPAQYFKANTIGRQEIGRLVEGDEDTQSYVEEYRRLAILNVLSLFKENISGRLAEVFKDSEAQGEAYCLETPETAKLKLEVAKDDPFEGRPFGFSPNHRTNYEPGIRGRPRKPAVLKIKRKRGRPRKTVNVPPITTDAPIASDLFFAPGGLQNYNERQDIDAQHV